jgi:selenocysteine lyase/cysteine desulfurase
METEMILDAAFEQFLGAYPDYESTRALDQLRAREYGRLDAERHVYLDYTGGGLYAESQLRAHLDLLAKNVFGNPHSSNPTSQAATDLVESARRCILRYFNTSPDEYAVIFTLNASGALKLVGESYPFAPGGRYALTFDNHNSVNGIREFARAKGARVHYLPILLPEMRVSEDDLTETLEKAKPGQPNLFAYPAQSNFSGVQHPLDWIERAQALGWDVLLDAAAFVPTNRLDLSRWHPDFVDLSFYKMFGYPTGVGCLLARRPALAKLRRPWFAGGTIAKVSVMDAEHEMAEGEAAFEDGTLSYLNVPAVEIGLKHLEAIGVDVIHERVRCLTGWLIDNLLALRHPNGKPAVQLYGPAGLAARGGTLAFNFYDAAGRPFNHRSVEHAANERMISLRTGTFCNPGGGEVALAEAGTELARCVRGPALFDEFRSVLDNRGSGAVRISVGLVSNFADVQALLRFAQDFVNQ